MAQTIRIIALCWLILIGGYFYGVRSVEYGLWPYGIVREIQAFLKGDPEENTSVAEKIENDLGLLPARHFVPPAPSPFKLPF